MSAAYELLLKRSEVAAMFGVAPETVSRWAEKGLIPGGIRTPGGQRRWPAVEVQKLLVPRDD